MVYIKISVVGFYPTHARVPLFVGPQVKLGEVHQLGSIVSQNVGENKENVSLLPDAVWPPRAYRAAPPLFLSSDNISMHFDNFV